VNAEWLDSIPVWGLLPTTAILLCLGMEGGYRLGIWRHARQPDEKDQPVGAMVASILGLLALVLGFTFSLAASRFEARRQVVLEEANAIGTTYLRASFLPDPQSDEVKRLLREYADVRLNAVKAGNVDAALSRSDVLHERKPSRPRRRSRSRSRQGCSSSHLTMSSTCTPSACSWESAVEFHS
jgi:hypothetical protein